MTNKVKKESKGQLLLSRIGTNGQSQKKQVKKETNPLLSRLDTLKKDQNKNKQGNKTNPLLAALMRGQSMNKTNNKVSKATKTSQNTRRKDKVDKRILSIKVKAQQQELKKYPLSLKIKNASAPEFLKIKNLETGTSAGDLRHVLERISPIKVVRVKDMGTNCIGEVIFHNTKALKETAKQLDGAIADGRVLEAKITNDSVTGINVK